MKVFINGILYSPEDTPIVLVFKDDAEKDAVIRHLKGMGKEPGIRGYASYPDGTDHEEIYRIFDIIKMTA